MNKLRPDGWTRELVRVVFRATFNFTIDQPVVIDFLNYGTEFVFFSSHLLCDEIDPRFPAAYKKKLSAPVQRGGIEI